LSHGTGAVPRISGKDLGSGSGFGGGWWLVRLPAQASLQRSRTQIDLAEFRANRTWKPLSQSLRKLATFAPTERAHMALVDHANAVREPIAWTWWKTLSPRHIEPVG
jgi:hypothetical protein